MKKAKSLSLSVAILLMQGASSLCWGVEKAGAVSILLSSEIEWEQLNPARGDKSPQAGTLWGDRKGEVATGFLAKFVDGFSSPPHIHNATYRAVVISGLIHNDDPAAEKMWMPPGSFWTQPKGESHITAAKGDTNIALVEIDQGPYLVMHADEAFDSGERPINIDPSNLVWLDVPGFETSAINPKQVYLWGSLKEGESNGSFIELPAGFEGTLQTTGDVFRAVVIKGELHYKGSTGKTLDPGSYLGATGIVDHPIQSSQASETIIYIRTNGSYKLSAE
ncbi:MAG: DUF4437 domain-containing protein [Opitutales bacterium]